MSFLMMMNMIMMIIPTIESFDDVASGLDDDRAASDIAEWLDERSREPILATEETSCLCNAAGTYSQNADLSAR